MWIEKYRPIAFDQLHGMDHITELLTNSCSQNKQIHHIFYGSPGTGKTTVASLYCKKLYPVEKLGHYILEINASHEYNHNLLTSQIKPFCQKSIVPFINEYGQTIQHKTIILDESDALTPEVQNALRRYIEIYSHNTRFIFLCNYISKIISPIVSRCLLIHFSPIPQPYAIHSLQAICQQEHIHIENETAVLSHIYQHHHGDLRACMSTIQAVWLMHNTINEQTVQHYLIQPSSALLDTLTIDTMDLIVETIQLHGYTVRQIIQLCLEKMSQNGQIGQTTKLVQFGQQLSNLELRSLSVKNEKCILLQILYAYLQFIS